MDLAGVDRADMSKQWEQQQRGKLVVSHEAQVLKMDQECGVLTR